MRYDSIDRSSKYLMESCEKTFHYFDLPKYAFIREISPIMKRDGWITRRTTNVDHQIHNQHISLNSLCTTHSPDVDDNHSRGAFCACSWAISSIILTIHHTVTRYSEIRCVQGFVIGPLMVLGQWRPIHVSIHLRYNRPAYAFIAWRQSQGALCNVSQSGVAPLTFLG